MIRSQTPDQTPFKFLIETRKPYIKRLLTQDGFNTVWGSEITEKDKR
jgi:hypothetical protein